MAAHNDNIIHDPGFERYKQMYFNRHKYFRFNRRTAWLTFIYVGAVPFAIGLAGYMTDGKWEMRGKRRGDIISEY
ncbi:hypothetical protein BDY21DRAFT_367965 [Lineolata rhizophorae]|uniref:Complex I-B15 n=1 Tax=Lineolata rhizophorae TaxID=578093 RepID=A0A6A6PCQ5_9PEZI|nr:hypothetical protein BDY21DRAFT_367965 [Lineolata rhizophorae]